ncbi:MAG TPA: hypothetical protein VMR31_18260 [Myxococcota bacterium]|nr:hypothetical protein [Myxococcota bacterium]
MALGALGAACDRRVQPYVDPKDEPPRAQQPVRVPGLETPAPTARMPLGPDADSGAPAAGMGERTGAPDGPPIRGTISLGEGVTAQGAVLFLIARAPGQPGPPLAVKRLRVGPFPVAFEIGPEDEMIRGRPWLGPIALTARVDRDGDPLTHDPGDASAELPSPVQPGAEGVELVLRPAASN